MNFTVTPKSVLVFLLLGAVLSQLVKPGVMVVMLAILLLCFTKPCMCTVTHKRPLLSFLQKYAGYILFIQCAVYALAYNALMPGGMYFSPDSVLYLSVSNIVPPTFSLLARSLIELEVALGSTRIIFLRYVVIAIFCMGGWLIAKALFRSKHPLLAVFVLPTIWSMSSLTQWFNYFLTDGIATAFLIACIGAYANMYVSIQEGEEKDYSAWRWLAMFVLFGMMAFSMRPAFAFVAPVMVIIMMNRAIFSWRRIAGVTLGITLLAAAHMSLAIYWHGRTPSQLGGVLTALVFDLPIPTVCPADDESDLCNTQRALEPFIQASNGLGTYREQYLYKVLNNGKVVRTARSAVHGNDPNYSVLLDIALLKIKYSPIEYVAMVLKNSYYSIKSWGDWAWNDSFRNVAKVNIANTNAVAPAVSASMKTIAKIDFNPMIKESPKELFYMDILLQFPRLVMKHNLLNNWTSVILIVVFIFSVRPFLFVTSLPGSILFSCCVFGLVGTIFQNAFFPVIPRLLDPFHPLGALGFVMLISMVIDRVKFEKLKRSDIENISL